MRWLHISDLHFDANYDPNKRGANPGVTTKKLIEKLPEYLVENIKPVDHLFITGDFRHASYQPDDVETAATVVEYILEIASSVGIKDRQKIHIVPGNHDLNRDDGDEDTIKRIIKAYDPEKGIFSKEDQEWFSNRFSFFKRINRLLYKGESDWNDDLNPLHTCREYDDFNIFYLNTSITCGYERDRHYLLIGTDILHDATKELNKNKPVIVLAHHATKYIHEKDRDMTINSLLEKNVILYLCGDSHNVCFNKVYPPDYPNNKDNMNLYYTEITMGCLQHVNGTKEAFCVGEIEGTEIKNLSVHHWDSDPRSMCWCKDDKFENEYEFREKPAKCITELKPFPLSEHLYGRDNVIDKIEDKLKDKSCIILTAMGGMGKTEICRHLFRRAMGEGLSGIDAVGWLNYNGSIISTFFNAQIEGIPKLDSEKPDDYFNRARRRIESDYGRKLLLFIDNIDEFLINDIKNIFELDCRILITSRINKIDRVELIEIKPLDNKNCIELYRHHSKYTTANGETLNEIIKLAGKHTLTIELLGKTQLASLLTAEAMLEKLRENNFDLSEFESHISYYDDRGLGKNEVCDDNGYEMKLVEHLSKVFDIAGIDDEQKRILCLFSLLPLPCVVSVDDAKLWFELEDNNELNRLVKKGWLQVTTESIIGYSIHPVLASAMRYKLNPTCAKCAHLIKTLNEALNKAKIFTDKLSILPYAESLARLLYKKDVNTKYTDSQYKKEYADTGYNYLLFRVYDIHMNLCNYREALIYAEKANEIYERVYGTEHPETATTYNNIAGVYQNQGDYAKALEWFYKALAICERVLGDEHPSTAKTYNNIATVYRAQGNYVEALEWYKKALAIFDKLLGAEHLHTTATIYHNIAGVYQDQGNYTKALEWYFKALAIFDKLLGAEHPDTATTYNGIGNVYYYQGDYKEALSWYEKALKIKESVLGTEHPSTATTYNNIALVYSNQGDCEKSLELYKKSLAIRERVLGADHPDTAATYNNIALGYSQQGDYANALEWFYKALAICERVLGAEHPNTARTYYNIACVYKDQGNYEKALELYKKALVIFDKLLGAEHQYTINTKNDIKFIQAKMSENTN